MMNICIAMLNQVSMKRQWIPPMPIITIIITQLLHLSMIPLSPLPWRPRMMKLPRWRKKKTTRPLLLLWRSPWRYVATCLSRMKITSRNNNSFHPPLWIQDIAANAIARSLHQAAPCHLSLRRERAFLVRWQVSFLVHVHTRATPLRSMDHPWMKAFPHHHLSPCHPCPSQASQLKSKQRSLHSEKDSLAQSSVPFQCTAPPQALLLQRTNVPPCKHTHSHTWTSTPPHQHFHHPTLFFLCIHSLSRIRILYIYIYPYPFAFLHPIPFYLVHHHVFGLYTISILLKNSSTFTCHMHSVYMCVPEHLPFPIWEDWVTFVDFATNNYNLDRLTWTHHIRFSYPSVLWSIVDRKPPHRKASLLSRRNTTHDDGGVGGNDSVVHHRASRFKVYRPNHNHLILVMICAALRKKQWHAYRFTRCQCDPRSIRSKTCIHTHKQKIHTYAWPTRAPKLSILYFSWYWTMTKSFSYSPFFWSRPSSSRDDDGTHFFPFV